MQLARRGSPGEQRTAFAQMTSYGGPAMVFADDWAVPHRRLCHRVRGRHDRRSRTERCRTRFATTPTKGSSRRNSIGLPLSCMVATPMKADRAPRAANVWLLRTRPRRSRRTHRFPTRCCGIRPERTLEVALAKLGVSSGIVAIIGGSEVFDMFLPLYDAFHLTRAAFARIPGGRPLFPSLGQDQTPEQALASHGLNPGPLHDLDAAAGITMTTWTRPPAAETPDP